MALLCGKVDKNTIQLVGRWKSDAVFRYLHAQALPIIRDLAKTILHSGTFTLLPGQEIPLEATNLITQYNQQHVDEPIVPITDPVPVSVSA